MRVSPSVDDGLPNLLGVIPVRNDTLMQHSDPLVRILLLQLFTVRFKVPPVGLGLAQALHRALDAPEGLEKFFELFLWNDPSHVRVHPVYGRRGSGTVPTACAGYLNSLSVTFVTGMRFEAVWSGLTSPRRTRERRAQRTLGSYSVPMCPSSSNRRYSASLKPSSSR